MICFKSNKDLNDMLKDPILKVLNKIYQPAAVVEIKFKKYDLAFKTDEKGRPILLFIGERDANGKIKGERYARRLIENTEGIVLKDHWDHKGKATAQLT
jgi:hypothetical protein